MCVVKLFIHYFASRPKATSNQHTPHSLNATLQRKYLQTIQVHCGVCVCVCVCPAHLWVIRALVHYSKLSSGPRCYTLPFSDVPSVGSTKKSACLSCSQRAGVFGNKPVAPLRRTPTIHLSLYEEEAQQSATRVVPSNSSLAQRVFSLMRGLATTTTTKTLKQTPDSRSTVLNSRFINREWKSKQGFRPH